jgi:hypothetical protein
MAMARASKKHIGPGALGKGDGSGSKTDIGAVPENMVLSNRDKSRHASGRGQDSKWLQTEQLHNHEANHLEDDN